MSNSAPKMNPFPGLRPFTQEEDYLFFGREEQTLELLARLGSQRFVAVVGASGSGKSSLVRCGLLSELQGGKMLGAGASWQIAVTHPGGNPLALLTEALLDADLYDRAQENSHENVLATLSRSHFGLVEAVKQAGLGEDTNFLLVVDQFEEIFRFHEAGQTQQEMANEFVSMLLEAATQKDVPIYVVLTMRSDFIGECGQFEGLAEMVNRGEFLIPRLTREQYKRTIEGPIKVAGGQIAPRLLQRLLNDLGQQADQLPCLQHALMRTWNVWAEKGDQDALDLDDYQRVGRMSEALSLHADEVYDSLASDRQRELCAGLFKALTVQESETRGIRRPQRLGRLCQILDVPIDELLLIIDAYRRQGVTFLMPSQEVALTDRTIIDISHESLMRVWRRLRNWVDEEAQAAGIYLRLSESAALYGQGKAGLYRDPELGIALAWQESQHPNAAWAERYRPGFDAAMAFLAESRRATVAEEQAREAARQRELAQSQELAESRKQRLIQQQRATRRLRKLIVGMAVVAVIAVLACVAALVARNEASRLANVAENEADHARQNEEKANENAERAERSQKETADALVIVESQKAKAEAAERLARAAEEEGRKLLYTTDMRLAPFVWRDDRATAEQLRVLLAKHIPDSKTDTEKPDLRGFEWHYYHHLLQSSALVFAGHGVSVTSGAFTSNGQLVTLDENGQVRRWDLSSQDEDKASRRDLPGGPNAQLRVLSPNGRLAALAEGNKVHVFDTSTGKESFQIDSAGNQRRGLIFSRDNDRLVIVDDKIRWVSAVSGEGIASVDQKFDRVESLAFSADGLTLAVVGHGNMGQQLSSFRLDPTAKKVTPLAKDVGLGGTLNASALSPDGQRIAVGAKLSGSLFVFDTATGRTITGHGSAHASFISALTYSSDGDKLATADAEGTIKIWADTQKLNTKSTALLTLKGHQGAITNAGFSSDGNRLVTTSADKTSRVWDLENAGAAIRPLEHCGFSRVAHFSPDGQLIAAAAGNRLRLWDGATGRLVRELSAGDSRGAIHSVAFSPTDNRLLAVGYGGQQDLSYVALWDIDAGTERTRLPGATDVPGFPVGPERSVVGALAFSPDGKHLVAGFGSKNTYDSDSSPMPLKVWEVATRRLIRRLNGHTGYCISLDFSRDGKLLASGGRDGTANIWSTQTWKKAQTLRNPDPSPSFNQAGRCPVEDVAFSPDGATLAVASYGGNVQLWNIADGKLQTLKGHSSAVSAVAFSPDGRTLASASVDQTVRLWNVPMHRELMQLDAGSVELGGVQSLAFSADGKHLLAGGHRGTAFWSAVPILWNDPDRAAEKLRLLLQSNADFPSRIRMLSENLRLHEALAKLDPLTPTPLPLGGERGRGERPRVQAALAATRANWHASQQRWAEAAKEVDRLMAADPTSPDAWLRTPGLLRLAMALLHQNRPADAAMLLQGGAKLGTQDPANSRVTGFGLRIELEEGASRLKERAPNSPASRSKLLTGDVIVKVDGVEMEKLAVPDFQNKIRGEVGKKLRLTVRHPGKTQTEDVDLVAEKYRVDAVTGELFSRLLAVLEKRLAQDPKDAGLFELRAELAGQESDFARQAADCTAAIEILAEQPAKAVSAHLLRLYRRRGDAYVGLKQWQKATDDYARVVTDKTKDEALLSNQALAQADSYLERESAATWKILKPTEMKSKSGAVLTKLDDDSILVCGVNSGKDTYTFITQTDLPKMASFRLEALAHESLNYGGPGRNVNGNFALSEISVKAEPLSGGGKAVNLKLTHPQADFEQGAQPWDTKKYPIADSLDGKADTAWSILPQAGTDHTAVFEIEPSSQTTLAGGTKLTFTLDFQSYDLHTLGRFRLSVSPDPHPFDREQKRLAATKLTDPWQKLAAVYRLQGKQQAIDQLVQRRPKLAGPIGDLFLQGKDEEKDWQRAVEIYSRGITAQTTDAELLSKRASAHEALKHWDAAAADWSRAAIDNPDGAKLLAEFARRLAAAGQVPLAKAQFEKTQALYERALAADPENDLVVPDLAQLLWDKHENQAATGWTVLKPVEAKSEHGATLSILPDQSVLASGANPANDRYRVVLALGTDIDLKAVRLEALTHPSLPGKGPGRTSVGGFAQTSWNVTAASRGRKDPIQLHFDNVWADHQIPGYPMLSSGHWNIAGGGEGRNCTSVWSMSKPVSLTGDSTLTFEMQFKEWNDYKENLGRFRLSVSGNPAIVDREQHRFAAMKLTDPWARLAAAYAVNGRNEEASQYFSRALKQADGYQARKPILEFAARLDEVVAALSKRQPDDPQLQLALARNLAERGKQRLLEKQPAKAQAELEKSREILTRLREGPKWVVLTPTELKSQGGETLTVERDGSIFVSGPNPNRAVYTLRFRTDLPILTAIRLETIPDARLPGSGAGRYANGNFHLSELTAALVSGQADAKPIPIEFRSAMADVSQESQMSAAKSIDGDPRTRWDGLESGANLQQPHWAICVLKSPVRMDGGDLRITLDSGITQWGMHGLGRFRLSVTEDTDLTRAALRNDLKDSEVVDLCIALAKARAQQGQTNEAVASFMEALSLAVDRAGKAKILAEAASLEGVLEKLTERAAGDGPFLAELARHYAAQGHAQLAEAARVKARILFEQQLADRPDNTDSAHNLADLLLPETTRWIVLKPTDIRSQGGESFTIENDGSLFVSGPNPKRAVYTLKFRPNLPTLAVIRLETIPDTRLPYGCAGRSTGNGNFHLAEFTAASAAGKTGGPATPLVISRAIADYPESENQTSTVMIDGNPRTFWEAFFKKQQAHWALFRLKSPARMDGDSLSITLDSGITSWGQHGLGRFRLSASDDPAAIEREQKRLLVQRLSDPWTKLAAAYHVIGDLAARDKLLASHPAATAGIGDLYALAQDWKQALAEFDRAITNGSKDARTFAARAEAHEKLEHWELAAADWGNADLHAIDKSERFGNPSRPALERRASIYASHLHQFDKQVQDCTELLKPERLGDNQWIFNQRGEAYDHLRQWDKALADFDRAVKVCPPNERESFQFFRARHFAAQGQWRQAADAMRPLYQKPDDANKEWWRLRDASLIFAMAGDVESYDKVVAECYRQQSTLNLTVDEDKWTIFTMLLFPEMITNENRPRLLELAGKTDAYWQTRLTAAIHFRAGDCRKAAEFFDANGPGPQFLFLAAMTYQKLGKQDRAKQLLAEGNAWIREQQGKDPGAGVPKHYFGWQDWVIEVALQYEASELILGPGVGLDKLSERPVGEAQFQAALARHFAAHGNAQAANAARTKAQALFADKLAKEPENIALAAGLAQLLLDAGRAREAIPHLAKASAANPSDTLLSLRVAALQAWFGQEKDLAAIRQRILAFAKDTSNADLANTAAKICSLSPSTDKAERKAALTFGYTALRLHRNEWTLLSSGMAEYCSDNYAAADKVLLDAANANLNNPHVVGAASFYRAMSLFRQGKKDEARKLAIATVAKMKPLPKEENNPLAGDANHDDLLLWLAYKEAKALIQFDAAPPPMPPG